MLYKITNVFVAALLVGTVFLAIVPTAEAQSSASMSVTLDAPNDKLKPLQGQITLKGTAKYVSDPSAMGSLIGVPVTYSVKSQPSWASVTISPQSDIFTVAASGSQSVETTGTFQVFISATENAPAYQAANIEITATATKPGAAGAAATGTGSVPIQAEFFSIIDVQLAEAIKVDRPQTPVVFPLTITNFGNANTKVSFEVLERSPNLEVLVPNAVTLQSRQAGGNQITSTVQLQILTPYKNGYMNEVGAVTYKITSAYALDSKLKGDETSVSVSVTTKGFYVPGFSPIFLIGLLGLAAIVVRRVRS